ncbi:hypothetical protein SERLA73DRAFT_54268, partial [Serpula lacrymans var. lacrymans S7.3]
FRTDRAEKVKKLITIGQELLKEQKQKVSNLIKKYADIFALSLAEVQPVTLYVHKLNLPPDVNGPTKI